MTHQFDLDKPSHLIANDVLRQLEILMSGSGLHVTFGTQTHDLIEGLVAQYQDKLMEASAKSRDNMRADFLNQEQEEIKQEAWLRQRLKTLRFPIVEDVYVSSKHTYYVTFSRLLSRDEILLAGTVSLAIERTPPLRNRYHIVFQAPDREEE
jgi:hypothetical protein